MKKNIIKVLVVIILLMIAIAILKIAPNYIRDEIKNKVNLVINNSNVTASLKNDIYIDENDVIYLSKEDIDTLDDQKIEEILFEKMEYIYNMKHDEAKKLNIPTVGIVDTNCNPEVLDYAIPGNDDAIRAVKLITDVMANAIIEGKQGESFEPATEIIEQYATEEPESMEEVVAEAEEKVEE